MAITVKEMLETANAAVPRISVHDARELVGKDNVVFVDLREPPEVAASGKVAGALAIPRGLIEFRADPDSPLHDAAFDARSSQEAEGHCPAPPAHPPARRA